MITPNPLQQAFAQSAAKMTIKPEPRPKLNKSIQKLIYNECHTTHTNNIPKPSSCKKTSPSSTQKKKQRNRKIIKSLQGLNLSESSALAGEEREKATIFTLKDRFAKKSVQVKVFVSTEKTGRTVGFYSARGATGSVCSIEGSR